MIIANNILVHRFNTYNEMCVGGCCVLLLHGSTFVLLQCDVGGCCISRRTCTCTDAAMNNQVVILIPGGAIVLFCFVLFCCTDQ